MDERIVPGRAVEDERSALIRVHWRLSVVDAAGFPFSALWLNSEFVGGWQRELLAVSRVSDAAVDGGGVWRHTMGHKT